jgi:hypothetical protein
MAGIFFHGFAFSCDRFPIIVADKTQKTFFDPNSRRRPSVTRDDTDVMIFKNIFAKKFCDKKRAFFAPNKANL